MQKATHDSSSEVFIDYKFDLEELLGWVQENNFKSIAVQLPEGLKLQGVKLIKALESELGIVIILLADPCFGACDISSERLQILGVDGVVHFGHAEIPNCIQPQIPIKYFELQANINPSDLIVGNDILRIIKSEFELKSSLGLVASVQFIPYLKQIKANLEKEGYIIYIGQGSKRIKYQGQVVGCNLSAAKAINNDVDGFIFIGDGTFHPLGVSLATKKKVLAFDPFSNTIKDISSLSNKFLRQRMAAVASVMDFINFGILISTKAGQVRLNYAKKLKNELITHNKSGTLIALDNITPTQIDYLPFDAYINTACPRLTIDDYKQFKKVLITPLELEIVMGERTWENYEFDEII